METLNQAQKQAVEHIGSPLLIVAGAGTGKTSVIANKIAFLIKNKLAKPGEILAVTFMEKAANEMGERVGEFVEEGVWDVWMSTFHGLGQRILETHGLEIGLSNNFKVLNEKEAWLLVRENLERFDLDYFRPLGNPTKFIHAMITHFNRCKDELITPENYLQLAEEMKLDKDLPVTDEEGELDQKKIRELADAYHVYNQILLENNALDFADLIFYTVKLFRERPNVLKHYQTRWQYILVDEFQDTNWAQYELIKLLTKGREEEVNLTVVGDDDQSIYKFRGATVSNILQFNEDFPESKHVVLTDNYRSGQKILDFAYNFIQLNNPDRLEDKLKIDKKLHSQKEAVGEVDFIHTITAAKEIQLIIKRILDLKNEKPELSWNDFAILGRSNNITEQFIPALTSANIPFSTSIETEMFKQKIVLDGMAALRMADNYHESAAIFRLLTCPIYNLSYEDICKLTHHCDKKRCSMYEALKESVADGIILSKEGKQKIVKFLDDIKKITETAAQEPAIKVVYNFFNESGYLRWLVDNVEEYANQIEYLETFLNYLEKFQQTSKDTSVKGWLKYCDYLMEAGDLEDDRLNTFEEGVRLLTVHKAKGLEFEYVFIPNMVEQRFPSTNRGGDIEIPTQLLKERYIPQNDADIEEERRLFYVALTRAKKQVLLTAAKDYGGAREKKVSRFIEELEKTNNINWNRKAETIDRKAVNNLFDQNIVSKKENTPPENFSFSQIEVYQKCPWQYRYKFVIKVPLLSKGTLSFGNTMHTTLQKFYEQMKVENDAHQGNLFGQNVTEQEIKVPSLEFLLNLYRENWQDDWFNSVNQKNAYREKGEQILKQFYEKNQNNGWVLPINLESSFRFRVGEHYFKGKIDRIDPSGENGVRLIDYKTGKPKTKLDFDQKLQLLIYQWAAEKLGSEWQWGKVDDLVYYYLDNNTELHFLGKEKDLERLEQEVKETISGIVENNFVPKPDKMNCAQCDFREICDFHQ